MNKECGEMMEFPKTLDEFIEQYSFIDNNKIYTNGSELIQTFRVKQWEEHKEKENINLKQALNEIREYANSDKLLKRFSEPRINAKGETHFDLIRNDILQIIDKVGGNDEKN